MPYEPRFLPHASERERPERVEDPTASHAARVCMWRSHNAIDALSTDTRTSRARRSGGGMTRSVVAVPIILKA